MTTDAGIEPKLHGESSTMEIDSEPSLRRIVAVGVAAIIVCFGGFAGWSLLAHLNSASVAQGMVVVDSHRKTVQHLEGGILRELLVREGEVVRVGQPLALLDTTQSEAQLGQLTGQRVAVEARVSRLQAEQQDRRTLTFADALLQRTQDAIVVEAIEAQRRLFEARWRAYDSSRAIIGKRIQQYKEQIAAAQAQLQAVEKRLALLQEDLRNATFLFERGYEKRSRLMDLQRSIEELNGQASVQRGVIAQAQQSIAGSEIEIVNLGDSRQAEVAGDVEEARAQEADLAERIRVASDVLNRREILSPQDGIVTDVRLMTPGGVIGPGQPLMDIVPVDDELIVEARVKPDDIDVVHTGLPAEVQVTAFKRSTTPPLDGTVTYVSADMLDDARSGEKYFLARVTLAKDQTGQGKRMLLSPGMPAEVMIVTGERRAFAYFVEPLQQRLRRAFREQ